MATDFVQATAKGGRSGKSHAAYIAGEGRYSDKAEVIFSEDGNLPKWAKTAIDFFAAADRFEAQARSGKGRSYRGLMIPIPHEAINKIAWAKDFAREVCGTDHAYRLGVHAAEGNPHFHLMFSERKTRHDLSPQDHFARGKNNKVRHFTADAWLDGVKDRMLERIKTLIPDYERKLSRGEAKIGPKLKKSGASYEAGRIARAEKVFKLREDEKTLASIISQIASLKPAEKKPSALDRVLSRPRPVEAKPALFQSPTAQAGLAAMRARAEKPATTVGKSKIDVAAKAAAQRAAAQKAEVKTIEREAAHDLTAGRSSTKAQLDAEFRRVWRP